MLQAVRIDNVKYQTVRLMRMLVQVGTIGTHLAQKCMNSRKFVCNCIQNAASKQYENHRRNLLLHQANCASGLGLNTTAHLWLSCLFSKHNQCI